uniref:nicotinate-nucleotide pyrophosphorylase [carboxylating]-like isoform X1 n=2 Tax=Oncorhynchus gorbuscha TaxID=8017 RepID=UPI001EAF7B39|nr:nicotinate-nucleotide pyrophosphorylase [carboxylating]-like isoform X1 [Oncorhynchus gorbuscha]
MKSIQLNFRRQCQRDPGEAGSESVSDLVGIDFAEPPATQDEVSGSSSLNTGVAPASPTTASGKQYKYNAQWEKTFPWLHFEGNVMFCKYCKAEPQLAGKLSSFVVGNPHLKKDTVKKHNASKKHIECRDIHIIKSTNEYPVTVQSALRRQNNFPASHFTSPLKMTTPQYDLSNTLPPHTLTRLAREWLAEDTPNFDPAGLCVGSHEVEARLLCKTPCSVLAGRPFFTAVFTELSCTVEWAHKEGAQLGPDAVAQTAVVRGPARCVLLGERPALNCLARASGIATRCSQLQSVAREAGWHGHVAGTRKTTPGFRLVEKYAMLVGGVSMHRQDLSGMVMLKDNHIWASGSITQAVKDARSVCGFSSKIEVECGSREEGSEAATAGADIVMLDNFKPQELHAAAQLLKEEFPSVLIEASGGVTPDSLPQYLSPHVDIISLGCITQGCPVVDFSLKVQKPVAFPIIFESQ